MLDRRHTVPADQHRHHIEAHPRPRPTRISEPVHRQHPNPTLLRERHRLRRTPVPDTRASLHLHEHNPITGRRNNIQLAVPTTPIAFDNLQTRINQELDSHILAPSPQRHIPRHRSPHHSHPAPAHTKRVPTTTLNPPPQNQAIRKQPVHNSEPVEFGSATHQRRPET